MVGVKAEEVFSKEIYEIYAKKVVNATGPWVDTIRGKDLSRNGKKLRMTKGVHLVFDGTTFPLQQAVYFDTNDGRMIFAIPREGKTYVGTTDTVYDFDPAQAKMTEKDQMYIFNAIHGIFPQIKLNGADVESSWAGVRPLIYEEGKDPSEISRKDEIWVSESGLLTIAGGKLTGFRKMAETVVDLAALSLEKGWGLRYGPCQTKNMPISGGHFGGSEMITSFIEENRKEALQAGFTSEQYEKLVNRYGSNINHLFQLAKNYDPLNKYDLPLDVYVQILYGIEAEMTVTPADFFIRRTSSMYFNHQWLYKWKQSIIEWMDELLRWSNSERDYLVKDLERQLIDAVQPNGRM